MTRPGFRHFFADTRAAAAVEFAFAGPVLIVMLFGVLQIGFGFQSYNAMRSASADVARYAMVQYGSGNMIATSAIETYAEDLSSGAPYLLNGVEAQVQTAAVQRVQGATELTLTLTYQVPTLLDGMGVEGPSISFARPMFLTT